MEPEIGLTPGEFKQVFPFHLAIDPDLVIVQAGEGIRRLLGEDLVGSRLADRFTVERPMAPLTFDGLIANANKEHVLTGPGLSVPLSGQMLPVRDHVLYLSSPTVRAFDELKRIGLRLRDFPIHDGTADLLLLTQTQQISLDDLQQMADKLKTQHEELQRALDAAEAGSRAKSVFLASMSHELRTPLNAIVGLSRLLASRDLSERDQRCADTIYRAGRHLHHLVGDVLDLSTFEQSEVGLNVEPFDLGAIASETIAMLRGEAELKRLELTLTLDATLPRIVVGDSHRLRQVLVNLLGNGIKFTEEGRVDLAIDRRGPTSDGRGCTIGFSVSDTGPGIAPADQKSIFQRFVRLSDERTVVSGVGLGLTISQHIVERMGGSLSLVSALGRGSRFSFAIDFEYSDEPVRRSRDSARSSGRQLRILIAEDCADNRLLLRELFRETQHEIVFAHDGEQAVALFSQNQFDAILMDIQMPGLDGLGATRAIRALEQCQALQPVPIIALSADALRMNVDRCLAAGCDSHIEKPLDAEVLFDALNGLPGSGRPGAEVAGRMGAFSREYLIDKARQIEHLSERLARGDLADVGTFGHRIKGTGASYGFPNVAELGSRLEACASSGHLHEAASLLRELEEVVSRHLAE
ncbi:MAG: ATP-binding protein [Planctomycetota bacterium]|jgi:signal transduction histidine kinase/DNA-binding NarL/FixJ family response regulator